MTIQTKDQTLCSPRRARGSLVRLGVGAAVVALTLAFLAGRSEAGMKVHNGLRAHNGMKVHNGLKIHNGMKVHNGLKAHNGMKVHNGLKTHNGMKVHNGLKTHNGMKVHNGFTPTRIWQTNGIDPRLPLSAAAGRAL